MDFSKKIYTLRKQKGLTLEEVGNYVGVGKSTVRKWEQGIIKNMRRDKIAKLATCLGVSPGYLMDWEQTIPPEDAKLLEKWEELKKTIPNMSPKMQELIETLPELDEDEVEKLADYAAYRLSKKKEKK